MEHLVSEEEAYRRLGLRKRNSGLKPADNGEPPHGIVIQASAGPVRLHTRIKCQRQPHIRCLSRNQIAEVWFGYADDCHGDVIQVERLAQDRAIASELVLPISVTE